MQNSNFDLITARRDTPGCKNVIHFNNAGAALMPKVVIDGVFSHLRLEATMGGYEAALQSHKTIEHVYQAVSDLIGCHREEVAIVENATRAWDMVFYAIPFKRGDRILTSMSEYASNYIAFLQVAQKTGATIEIIPNDMHGQVSLPALQDMVDEKVKLIAITHVPTNGGLVNPVTEIGDMAGNIDAFYLLDACQSIGQMPIDVNQIGCDFLSATGRKYLRGPRGTGFLYVRRNLIQDLEPPLLDLHAARWTARNQYKIRSDARRFENWESNIAGKIGLGIAVDYARHWGLDSTWNRIQNLSDVLRIRLAQIQGVQIQDLGTVKCGIVTFTVHEKDPHDIHKVLMNKHMNVSVSSLESTRLDMESRNLKSVIRASVHYYNTEDEIERFCEAIEDL